MSKRILLIEDEEFLSDMYKMKFEHEGYEVLTAMDGETGIEIAQSEKPDLVLLDIVLPKMNGFQVLKTLRENSLTAKLKIYFLSNLGQDEEVAQGLKDGADGYIIKTNITPSELATDVEKIFAGQRVGEKDKTPSSKN